MSDVLGKLVSMKALIRIARRDAWRAKGRSILIITMIALPIAAMTLGDITARTAQLSSYETLDRKLGEADVLLSSPTNMQNALTQNEYGVWGTISSPMRTDGPRPTEENIQPFTPPQNALPTGTPFVVNSWSPITVKTNDGNARLRYHQLDYANPIVKGVLKPIKGNAPSNDNEVSISQRSIKELGVNIGDTLQLTNPERQVRITGVIEDPQELRGEFLVGKFNPQSANSGNAPTRDQFESTTSIYAKLSTPLTWTQIKEANAKGVVVESRHLAQNPPPRHEMPFYSLDNGSNGVDGPLIALVTLIGGMTALEICLLAGAAFAVGAKRQRRMLGLIGATGGSKQQIGGVVLMSGLVLGVVAAIVGLTLGVVASIALIPIIERLSNQRFGNYDLRILEVAAITSIAIVASLLSAYLPARAASRLRISDALAGRQAAGKSSRRFAMAGFAIALMGGAIAALGAFQQGLTIVLAGSVVSELGLVIATPLLIGLVARSGSRLPLAPRLALRDAVRNKSRTAPAVAAIMAGVAGAVSISMYVASSAAYDRNLYSPGTRPGQVLLVASVTDGLDVARAKDVIAKHLPIRESVALNSLTPSGCNPITKATDEGPVVVGTGKYSVAVDVNDKCYEQLTITRVAENKCPVSFSQPFITAAERKTLASDPRCQPNFSGGRYGGIYEGNEAILRVIFGNASKEAVDHLARGGVLVTDQYDISNGKVLLGPSSDPTNPAKPVELPGMLIKPLSSKDPVPTALVSKETAAKTFGFVTTPSSIAVIDTTRMPTKGEEKKANAELHKIGFDNGWGNMYVERGFQSPMRNALLILIGAGLLIALLATGIATGLALADGRSDQATLAAVGAGPHTRRISSAFQAATVALLGVGLGTAAGLVPGAAFAWTRNYVRHDQFFTEHLPVHWLEVIPFPTMATLLIATPVIAALFAAAFTSSKITFARRN